MYSSGRKIPQDLGLSPGQWFERGNRLFKNANCMVRQVKLSGLETLREGSQKKLPPV